ncbi:MAG: DNA polymerase III subunit delta' [Rhodobacteraceae bacterium]|nr:DNA polymerase III subunit delta' [Paracoccaceae bacterium]
MTDPDIPEPDKVEGAPHPRETAQLHGQGAAERAFLDVYNSGRLHHGWLLTGPRGVGKATLAWRIARFLLATPQESGGGLFGDAPAAPETLDIAPDHPVARRLLAGSEGRLFLLRRGLDDKTKQLKTVITVEEVRKLKSFLSLSAADGGRRVVIVDPADELNTSAANALLKLLEEPPAGVTILLVAHQPSGLLPTIRSRCRELRLAPLAPDDLAAALSAAGAEAASAEALAALSGGSVGEAVRLINLGGIEAYAAIVDLFGASPRLDRIAAARLADSAGGRAAEARFDLLLTLMDLFIARLARSGIDGPPLPEAATGEAALLARASPDAAAGRVWADLHQSLGARARHGKAVNLDPGALLLDMILKIDETAGRLAAR